MENCIQKEAEIPKEMNWKEKVEEAKNIRYIIHEKEQYSEERAAESSLEFSRLEVQIAIVMLAITSVFWNIYSSKLQNVGDHSLIKFFFALVLFLLMSSLALGLLHLKIVENFWDRVSGTRAIRFNKWQEVILHKTSFEDAQAFQEGTKIGNGNMIYVPNWTWILQSVLLGISIVIILIMSIAFIIMS